jgi:DNA-3-methyladenine glycosylase I
VSEIAAKAHRDSVARAGYRGGVIEPRPRCAWAGADRPDPDVLMVAYHDDEWGRPCHDDTELFERLALESFQAGLSWSTILRKREAFRAAFAGFDFHRVARFTEDDVERLLQDAGIVRHRGKIEATINNAQRAAELTEEQSLAHFVWSYDDPKLLARDLKKRGWRFVGTTTVYAFMQAMGLVNDHLPGCDAREPCERERAAFVRPSR